MTPQEQWDKAQEDRDNPDIQRIPSHLLMEKLEPLRAQAEMWRRIARIAPQELFPEPEHLSQQEREIKEPSVQQLLTLSGLLEIYENGLLDPCP